MTKPAFITLSMIAASSLAGCSSMSDMIPSLSGAPVEHSIAPSGSTEYQCAGGNKFYVKFMNNGGAKDKGDSAWLIYPDREVLLTRATGAGTRYTNDVAMLEINNNEATLNDGPGIAYTGCKIPAPDKK
jgi:hypothetical protein